MAEEVWLSGGTLVSGGGAPLSSLRIPEITVTGQATLEGGVAQEQISFTTGELSTTAALATGSGVPRFTLPDAATTSVFFNFAPPNWWDGFNILASWVNDHTATGNVRYTIQCRETDYATQAISAGALIVDTTATSASPSANGGLTFLVLSSGVTRTPGAFGSLYSFTFTRLGADGADTLAGPVAVAGFTIGRV